MTKPIKWCAPSEDTLCAQWVAKDPRFHHADREDSDQTGQLLRLIWVLNVCKSNFVGFVMLQLICMYCRHRLNCYSDPYKWAPHHDKTCFCHMRTTRVQISLHIRNQHLCLPGQYKTSSFYIQNFKPLPSFSGCTGWFVSFLVANPNNRFSCDEAELSCKPWQYG